MRPEVRSLAATKAGPLDEIPRGIPADGELGKEDEVRALAARPAGRAPGSSRRCPRSPRRSCRSARPRREGGARESVTDQRAPGEPVRRRRRLARPAPSRRAGGRPSPRSRAFRASAGTRRRPGLPACRRGARREVRQGHADGPSERHDRNDRREGREVQRRTPRPREGPRVRGSRRCAGARRGSRAAVRSRTAAASAAAADRRADSGRGSDGGAGARARRRGRVRRRRGRRTRGARVVERKVLQRPDVRHAIPLRPLLDVAHVDAAHQVEVALQVSLRELLVARRFGVVGIDRDDFVEALDGLGKEAVLELGDALVVVAAKQVGPRVLVGAVGLEDPPENRDRRVVLALVVELDGRRQLGDLLRRPLPSPR